MSEKKSNKAKVPAPEKPKGGINISSGRDTSIGGDVIDGDKTVENTNQPQNTGGKNQVKKSVQSNGTSVPSAWANGLFYLFIFVTVAGVIGLLAGKLDSVQLGLVIVAGLLAVPLIGALQLRMDKRLSEKNFYELIKLTISQLPIIRGLVKGQK